MSSTQRKLPQLTACSIEEHGNANMNCSAQTSDDGKLLCAASLHSQLATVHVKIKYDNITISKFYTLRLQHQIQSWILLETNADLQARITGFALCK